MDIQFEVMSEQHGADVMSIFNHYVENGFSAFPEKPLPEQFFCKFLEMTKGYPAFVMRNSERLVTGFCFLRPHSPFAAFSETAEVTYFMKEDCTGQGLGTAALQKLESEARCRGIKHLLACISSKNVQSIAFHRRNGFDQCGTFRGIGKKKGVEFDVVWMQKDLV